MRDTYETPLNSRYASKEMQKIFSPDRKFTTWRKLWVALAESEMEMGLPVTQKQVDQLREHIEDVDYDLARQYEQKTRHDVMAHVLAYGDQCPEARGVIHLGATSCYVTDNADILMLRDAIALTRTKILEVLRRLKKFALQYRALPTLGLTHLQPAQLTTVGKRACLWMQDLWMDLQEIDFAFDSLRLLGNRGATGTQESFLKLFDGDGSKVDELEARIAHKMGMEKVFPVSGQTYPRKLDSRVLGALAGVAQSAYKFAQDLRLLQSFREVEEPFESGQIGSSAMAYKRNPMRSERICALARHVMALTQDAQMTAATQWFERTLDDSANRRLSLPEAFLSIDAVLELYANIASAMVVYPATIIKRVQENLPFMATEAILMECVRLGGDRQTLHERIRVHSQEAARRMKAEGAENDLMERIAADDAFPIDRGQLTQLLQPSRYTGRATEQVERFVRDTIDPVLEGTQERAMGEILV
ncbi:MAG TPA: adenylosuccinate lyase [Candidatus Pullichristensenella excrementigallinarum]|uniref:Adenylosuccinate lyase n=1 Tax=Candidatus Pullichristensenella excrementigallinarum TaxID=2840907 RepID=A0A9D1ICR1_9FIRM|nr:adenylosuccinate lyase [Candidatus Pullichristensenella excrementigallinarum]